MILGIYKSLTDTVHECRNRETEHYNSVLEITKLRSFISLEYINQNQTIIFDSHRPLIGSTFVHNLVLVYRKLFQLKFFSDKNIFPNETIFSRFNIVHGVLTERDKKKLHKGKSFGLEKTKRRLLRKTFAQGFTCYLIYDESINFATSWKASCFLVY